LTELHGRIAAIPSVDADAVYRGYLSRTVTRAPRGSPSLVRNMGHRRRLLHRHERCLSLPSLSAWRWAPLRAWSTVPSVSGGAHVHGQGGAHGAARRSWISATSMTSLRHTRGRSNLGPPSSGPSSPAGGTWEISDSLPSRTVALVALRRVRHRTRPASGSYVGGDLPCDDPPPTKLSVRAERPAVLPLHSNVALDCKEAQRVVLHHGGPTSDRLL
jgi:hypothetical protein